MAKATRVTCKTIAEHLGISKQTVTHVLGDRAERFRPETVARVERATRELGYRTHAAAKAMRTGRQRSIELVAANATPVIWVNTPHPTDAVYQRD
jgi:LacI family transcriptional regulator